VSQLSSVERYRFRKIRTRSKIYGTPDRPRLSVRRSQKHMYVQVIDDTRGHTLAAASTTDKELAALKSKANVAAAKEVGKLLAQRAQTAGIKKVVFDRGALVYHGRVKAVADGAREAGLEF